MTRFVIFILMVLAAAQVSGQVTDSLLRRLPQTTDTERVKTLYQLCFEYAYHAPEKGKRFGMEALELARKLKYTMGTAKSLNRLGIVYDVSGKYDSALYYYAQAGMYYDKAKSPRGKAAALNNTGMVYSTLGNYKQALEKHFEALKIFEAINDQASAASALNNIGNVYADLSRFSLAFHYYYRASLINRELNDQDALASNYTNIATSLRACGRLDSAMLFANKSAAIQVKNNNHFGLGIVYQAIGNIYHDQHNTKKALEYMLRSLKLRNEINDDAGKSSLLLGISEVYLDLRDMAAAEKYALETHAIALRLKSYRMLRKTSMYLFQIYTATKNYEKAAQYVDVAMAARDSTINDDSNRHMAEMEVKYESEKKALELQKKDLALANASLEIKQKRNAILLLATASVLIIMAGLFLYRLKRLAQQREHDRQLLAQQKLRNKAIIEAEEKERIRIARELHDGIGQQLSAAKLNLSAFETLIPDGNRQAFNDLEQMVDDAVKEIRSISHNMIPNALLRSGLVSALRDFVNRLSGAGALKVDLAIVGINDRLDTSIETGLYRVVQESVSNIVKHAQANRITIQVIRHDNHLNLMIEDNGIGFDTSAMNNFEGIGLRNIVSRVQYLNGRIDIDSAPGRGTTVNVDIPLATA